MALEDTPFKTATGEFRTKSLFLEKNYGQHTRKYCLYTLKDVPHEGLPSLYQKYMEVGDPLEISFAEEYLYSYEHWLRLCECSWFKPFVTRWRKELELKIRSQALRKIALEAGNKSSRNSFAANRFLVNGDWKDKEEKQKNTKGRPSKDDIKKEAVRLAQEEEWVDEDAHRLKIN